MSDLPAVDRARAMADTVFTDTAELPGWVSVVRQNVLPELVEAYETLEVQAETWKRGWLNLRRIESADVAKLNDYDRVVALNTRLTAALRVLLDAIPGTFAGWRPYMEADQAARALLAETENT